MQGLFCIIKLVVSGFIKNELCKLIIEIQLKISIQPTIKK